MKNSIDYKLYTVQNCQLGLLADVILCYIEILSNINQVICACWYLCEFAVGCELHFYYHKYRYFICVVITPIVV